MSHSLKFFQVHSHDAMKTIMQNANIVFTKH